MICNYCPRHCNTDRSSNKGFCNMGERPVVAKAFLHMWEEPCISGVNGSGTVFFSGCNLKCVYCQNFPISQQNFGKEISEEELSKIFIRLMKKGAHNINLVNPSHFVFQIRNSIEAVKGLDIPVVYNSNGYEGRAGLEMMDGWVDVYLPDFKYYSKDVSLKYSGAPDYSAVAADAIIEMYRQVGDPVFDKNGIIKSGLIIRHLILPGLAQESIRILDWIKENLPQSVMISLMSQYIPFYKADSYNEINRRITRKEYEKVVNHAIKIGLDNGYIQERCSAEEEYVPEFDLRGVIGEE
ncbi:MAG: radical SAM protein [Clostridia bacterium]|nr:radical SAM protein [Clostridia bacterium]